MGMVLKYNDKFPLVNIIAIGNQWLCPRVLLYFLDMPPFLLNIYLLGTNNSRVGYNWPNKVENKIKDNLFSEERSNDFRLTS